MKKNIMIGILFIIIIILSLYIFLDYKSDNSLKNPVYTCDIPKNVDSSSLDNSLYLGIYNYIEYDGTTTLVLNSDYSCIFYIGNDVNKVYYYGKYKIEDKKIILYSMVMHDSSSEHELYVDEEIYFNIVDSNVITSIYGRDKSIRLEKLFNLL